MLTASKNGRKIRAMVMKEPVDRCFGDADSPGDQVDWFLEHHECRALAGKRPAGRKPS